MAQATLVLFLKACTQDEPFESNKIWSAIKPFLIHNLQLVYFSHPSGTIMQQIISGEPFSYSIDHAQPVGYR
jgi:hypothetical protein